MDSGRQGFQFFTPPAKDIVSLTWRYKDPLRYDDMWTYVPTLRRTLRMVSSERANPIQGTPLTWDEIFCFDGKIPQFTYKLLGEKTVLSLANQNKTADDIPGDGIYRHPIIYGPDEPFELVDTYLIEIKSKNPRYPTSLWHLWVKKKHFGGVYAEMYNKRGDFWKAYNHTFQVRPLGNTGEEFPISLCSGITDFITETWILTFNGKLDMNTGLSPYEFDPGSLDR